MRTRQTSLPVIEGGKTDGRLRKRNDRLTLRSIEVDKHARPAQQAAGGQERRRRAMSMAAHRRGPGWRAGAALTVAVLAVSSSAPLIAYAAAPALAIAFWRNGLAAGVLTPVSLGSRRAELRAADRRDLLFCVLAGVAL